MMPIRLILSLLLAILPTPQCQAARSLQARRVQTRRTVDRYDRSITTFSPEGRLLQLEYALIAAEERGRGLTVCVECDGIAVFAFPSSDDDDLIDSYNIIDDKTSDVHKPITIDDEVQVNKDDEIKDDKAIDLTSIKRSPVALSTNNKTNEHNPTFNTKIHRLSPTSLLLTSGLAGDARVLASAFQRMAASWTHVQYGEVVTARELAKEMGKVRHAIGLKPGARVLGVVGILIGLDDVDDITTDDDDELGVEVRMYRSLPGGTLDRCNVCCTGGGADANGNAARKDATTSLLNVLSTTNRDDMDDNQRQKLQQVIEEVGRVALKYHPDQNKDDETHIDAKRVGVDIWLVRASATEKRDETSRAVLNPYRYLGKALMETRYARRVALDQLSTAVQALIDKI